jgi:hypothetical protein
MSRHHWAAKNFLHPIEHSDVNVRVSSRTYFTYSDSPVLLPNELTRKQLTLQTASCQRKVQVEGNEIEKNKQTKGGEKVELSIWRLVEKGDRIQKE